MRRVSKKRARENRKRRKAALEAFGRFPACAGCQPLQELGIWTGCDGRATDAHEILSRARGGSITDPANILPLGRLCHSYVTTHPRDAERAGLSRSAGPRSLPMDHPPKGMLFPAIDRGPVPEGTPGVDLPEGMNPG